VHCAQPKENEDDYGSNDELSDGAGGKAGGEVLESRKGFVNVSVDTYLRTCVHVCYVCK